MKFKSKEGYRRWLAFGHIHGQFEATPGHQPISIGGRPHKVKHAKKTRKRRKK